MLVLTRKANEEILIGDNIKITLVRIKGGSVRVGIEAPRDVRIVRGELKQDDATDTHAETDALAEVFAHPEAQNMAGHLKASVNQFAGGRIAQTDAVTAATKTDLFVGTVSRSGNEAKLRRAPLSGFVAAG